MATSNTRNRRNVQENRGIRARQVELSGTLWRDVIFGRSLHDALGSPIVFWADAAVVIFCSRESIQYFVLLIALYVSPFLLFTNLHIVHGYYQYPNALFVVLAVALVVAVRGPKYLKINRLLLT
jgi:hypothetical protein